MALNLSNKIIKIWNKAEDCNCGDQDCNPYNHKLCCICRETILYGAHESVQPTSWYAWNTDHKKSLFNNGTSISSNLRAVHIRCNRKKGNK